MRRTLSRSLLALAAAFACTGAGVNANAADLLQTYREARANDPQFASARAAAEAGREKGPQGRALILPAVSASANTTWNDGEVTARTNPPSETVERQFNSNGWTVTLSQPLFRWQNWVQYTQYEFQVRQTEAQFTQAMQDLIVRVAQAYFEVLAAQDSLAFILAQKAAISEQLAQAKRNFEVGTATITDTHEAQARFDLSVAQEIAAQNDVEIRRRALQQLIGRFPDPLTPLRGKFELRVPDPDNMDRWVESAQSQNYAVLVQQAAVEIAQREIERNRAGHYPTLDLVGTYGKNSAGSNFTTGIGTDTKVGTIGLQLAIPLYAGGSISSRTREAVANREKAHADLETSRRQAALSARQSFLGVTNGMAQVRALEQAQLSSETALASNKLGYEVGPQFPAAGLPDQARPVAGALRHHTQRAAPQGGRRHPRRIGRRGSQPPAGRLRGLSFVNCARARDARAP
jgi:outer membrane protein